MVSPVGASPAGDLAGLQAQLAQQLALPPLREDLALHPGSTQKDGAPSWVIEDPLKGRFYRIGWLEFEVLARWHLGDAARVVQSVSEETLLAPEVDEVLAIRQFLLQHELLVNQTLLEKAAQGSLPKPGMATQALHNYLMFRLPLVNPDRFLEKYLSWFAPLLRPKAFALSMLAGFLGLVLALQQWDTFAATFVETLSLQGLLSYSVALVLAKALHELGHALTAKQLGLRVPRMGVAIVLLLPMLYTDTGETWRLTRRRDRFAIAAAGMRIELMLAAWCTLAWSFLPDGALRGAMFFLATTSWIMTLAVNASPFMRFDGYYMMSDATGIPNLHDEAGKVMRHFLRKHLLGFEEAEPALEGEAPPPWLLWFGLGTAVYRFFLFLGIAVTVYHYFFQGAGHLFVRGRNLVVHRQTRLERTQGLDPAARPDPQAASHPHGRRAEHPAAGIGLALARASTSRRLGTFCTGVCGVFTASSAGADHAARWAGPDQPSAGQPGIARFATARSTGQRQNRCA